MKNTTLVMGILVVLATLSGCGISDAGSVGVGSEAGSYNAGRARREEIVTTNTSTRLPSPRVNREAVAPQSAFRIIILSPSHVNRPLSAFPKFKQRIPTKPMPTPMSFCHVILSLLKKIQARMTTENTLIELRIAAREP